MHQAAFHELARAGFMEEKALHPGVTPWGMPRPLIEPADGRLRGGEVSQHGIRLKRCNVIRERSYEVDELSCQRNIHLA
jgi:hypothetical protein